MSETALYRKYRPAAFADVVGQEHVVKVLEGSLAQGKTAHAYLFAGPRGTGKTSVARILAKALGCSANDLYEIDAASNRGVDEIRELREGVRSLPFESDVKVYIIDEVHMLTKEAFNALLKTLEEPPKHVVFILATTELHKLPDTIVSRCQTFAFKQPSVRALEQTVKGVAEKEGAEVDGEAANLIALLGDGSFRDTLGILQKVLGASAAKKIVRQDVQDVTGSPSAWLVYNFIIAVVHKDVAGGLSVIAEAVENNYNMKTFLKLALREIRLAMLLKFAPEMEKDLLTEAGEEEVKFLLDLKGNPSSAALPAILKELLGAYETMGNFYLPQLALEIALVKLAGEGKAA